MEQDQERYLFRWSDVKITGWIYFIEFQEKGPVKIGYATNVDKRLNNIQSSCPYELNVLCATPGGIECEKILHKVFADSRIRGEWFWPTRIIRMAIRRLKSFEREYPDFLPVCREMIKDKVKISLFDFYGARPVDFEVTYKTREQMPF